MPQINTTASDNTLVKFAWNVLFVISYPVITTFSLLFVSILWVFSSLSKLLSRISASKETVIEIKKPTWQPMVEACGRQIEKIYVDDILFGPNYYSLRTNPAFPSLEGTYFGDFNYKCFDGVLLQKWNSTSFKDLPDFTLVYLNCRTGELKEIERIKSFSWSVQPEGDDAFKFRWFSGTQGGEIVLREKDLV